MNIQAVQSFKSSQTPHRRSAGVTSQCFNNGLQTDTFVKEKHLPKTAQKSQIGVFKERIEKEQLLKKLLKEEDIARKEALRSKFVTPTVRRAILNNRLKETTILKIVNQLKHYPDLLGELFLNPPGGGLMIAVSDKTMKKICTHFPEERFFAKMVLSKDAEDNGFFDKASSSKIKIFNERASKFPKVLQAAYTQPNAKGQIPAHYISPEALDSMNIALKKYPEIIKKIYTTTDKKGNTPAHNRFYYGQAVIAKALEKQIPTASIVYGTKNSYGEYFDASLNWAEKYRGPYNSTWDYILQNF